MKPWASIVGSKGSTRCHKASDTAQAGIRGIEGRSIDAAIAKLEGYGRTLGCATPFNGYGAPDALATDTTLDVETLLNTPVQKYRRTTGLTKGTIVSINWEGNLGYSAVWLTSWNR